MYCGVWRGLDTEDTLGEAGMGLAELTDSCNGNPLLERGGLTKDGTVSPCRVSFKGDEILGDVIAMMLS